MKPLCFSCSSPEVAVHSKSRYPLLFLSLLLNSVWISSFGMNLRLERGGQNSSLFSFLSVFCFLIGNLLRGMRFRRPRFLIIACKEVLSAPPRGGNAEGDRPSGAEIVINALGSLSSKLKLVRTTKPASGNIDMISMPPFLVKGPTPLVELTVWEQGRPGLERTKKMNWTLTGGNRSG